MRMELRRKLPGAGLFVSLACLLLVSGCAGLGPQTKPRVSLANLQVQEVRGLETVFLVELRILNPGDVPLQLRGIDCELLVDGRPFAAGLSGGSYEVAPYGSLTVPVPVYASMLDMVASVVARLQQPPGRQGAIDPLRYEVTGHVRLAGGMGGTRTLPFASKGELSLLGPPPPR
jgi:LEA14-like dessication related protein